MFGFTEAVLLILFVGTLYYAYTLFRGNSPPPPKTGLKSPKQEQKGAEVKDDGKLPMTVFFGSQSGTAETYAIELAEEAKAYGFRAKAVDLEDFEDDAEELVKHKFAVFLMATFGEGEPTDNAQRFYEWINAEDREEGSLRGLDFAVFALGNRQYEHFCSVGRRVDERLRHLGSHPIVDHGEGDDDGSLEDDYAEWKGRFWQAARAHFKLAAAGDDSEATAFKPSIGITFFALPKDAEPEDDVFPQDLSKGLPPPEYKGGLQGFQRHTDPKLRAEVATVSANRELRLDLSERQTTRHIELDIKGLRLKYVTADNLGVYPRNDPKMAAALAKRLRVDRRAIFKLEKKANNRKLPIPSPCKVQEALEMYCDFNNLVRVKLLKTLAQYAEDGKEKERLLHYANEGKDEFVAERKSLFEVLQDFPSVHPPFEHFLEWCPKLQPRFYTISSSSKANPSTVHLTVALTVAPNPNGRVHFGVASSYLCGLKPGEKASSKLGAVERLLQVCVFVRPSTFRFPKKPGAPVIMVGPGTGVAPFRAFVQEVSHLTEKQECKYGPLSLYFGCRHPAKDFIYQDEMEAAAKAGVLNLITAFSRYEEKKVYVQTRLNENREELWKLLHTQHASFYVCGGTAMGRDIRESIVQIAEKVGGMTTKQAQDFLKKLQTEGRYIQELWS